MFIPLLLIVGGLVCLASPEALAFVLFVVLLYYFWWAFVGFALVYYACVLIAAAWNALTSRGDKSRLTP